MSLFNRLRYWFWEREVMRCLRTAHLMWRNGEPELALLLCDEADKYIAKMDRLNYGSIRA
jgi:hypothetical protein